MPLEKKCPKVPSEIGDRIILGKENTALELQKKGFRKLLLCYEKNIIVFFIVVWKYRIQTEQL